MYREMVGSFESLPVALALLPQWSLYNSHIYSPSGLYYNVLKPWGCPASFSMILKNTLLSYYSQKKKKKHKSQEENKNPSQHYTSQEETLAYKTIAKQGSRILTTPSRSAHPRQPKCSALQYHL